MRALWFLRHDPNNVEDKKYFAVSWSKAAGKGKVFYTSLGHREDLWSDDPALPGRINSVELSKQYQAHLLGGIKWAPPNGRDSVQLAFIAGPGRFDTQHNFNNPNILDLVYTHQFGPRLTETFEGLVGYQDDVPGIGSAHWFGGVNYLTYTLSPRLSVTSRLECFDDAQGQLGVARRGIVAGLDDGAR